MRVLGRFHRDASTYGVTVELPDSTRINVVTVFTGPGIAADTELEANRPLTEAEVDAALDAADYDESLPLARGPALPLQRRV
jgi:hypothetical protein